MNDDNDLTLTDWRRSLRAANLAPRTVESYLESARAFAAFLGTDRDLLTVSRRDVEAFIEHLLDTRSPSTAAVRYRSLQQLYRWALGEELITASPMATMRPPAIPEKPVPVIAETDLRALLKACEGTGFTERRDMAMIRLMSQPGGLRAAEVIGLAVDDFDLDTDVALVLGKGRRPRTVPFGAKTGQALSRYLRVRRTHRLAAKPALWLAQKGAVTDSGLRQMLERRCALAGITRIHPHQLRHTAAHAWFEAGGSESDAMRLFGWRSRERLTRYASSTADDRARIAARRLSLGDRL